MFGNQIYEDNPTGRVAGKSHFHHPFKLIEMNYYLKHNKNYFRNTDGIPYEKSRLFKQHHTSVTVDMNNLGNPILTYTIPISLFNPGASIWGGKSVNP